MEEGKNEFENDPIKKQDDEKIENQLPIDRLIEKKSTIDRIFEELDSLTKQQASKKKKNARLIDTISGKQINIDVLAAEWQKHEPQYHLDFYAPVFKLLNIPGDPACFTDRFDKRLADFKNEVIWGRFDRESFKELRRKNKYSGYFIRRHWHYQGLNNEGIAKLKDYIQQAINAMEGCTTYYEFRQKMHSLYRLGYQIEL